MMALRKIAVGAIMTGMLTAGTVPATAHDAGHVARQLSEEEVYFQLMDRAAPKFGLEDAGGDVVSLSDFVGQIVVLNFVYASCTDICPMHSQRIAELQEMINGTPMRDMVQFVSITTDPVKDTPEVMRSYGALHGLDDENWVFLTSGQARPVDTRDLAAAFGHRFDPAGDGSQIHGLVTHVIDQDGRHVGNFHGLDFDPVSLVSLVNALTNAKAPHLHKEGGLWDRLIGHFTAR
ncbi:SCO family protein [Caenispirillum salinarum]|uniref:SCO family protein n=1 Tax=Caenispirillum salinarum TaxID=859058 RepID=UPI00384B0615